MTDTSYISSMHDWDSDDIIVWERPIEGGPRSMVRYKAPRYFYVPDEDGQYTGIDGRKLKKLVYDTQDAFKAARQQHSYQYESDINVEARVLMDEYHGRPTPKIHFAFLDIEVDYSSKIGWSTPENPYAVINAVTIYQSWTDEYITYVIPPKGFKMSTEEFEEKIAAGAVEHKFGFKPNVNICKNERELLAGLLAEIEDADIISGWNSEFFDNPYIIKRLERVLGKTGVAKMCFTGAKPPRERMINRFGSEAITYQLSGRTHMDYLDMFKKFTFEGRVSYSLANIAADELDVPKLDYPGTLEELYNNDFVLFCLYNMRDVEVIYRLDKKFKFMQLVNQMSHENTVPFAAILGTVRYVETGIMNRAKNVHGLISTNKVMGSEDNEKVEGAVVMTPQAGLHPWIGAVDIVSLYPNCIMMLNMSIETFVGQFVGDDETFTALRDLRQRTMNTERRFKNETKTNIRFRSAEQMAAAKEAEYTFVFANGSEKTESWQYWNDWLKENKYAISGFGTVFDQSKPGMVADTLMFWFKERKRLQGEKKKYGKLAKEETDPEKKAEYKRLEEEFDLLQLTKKIQLNSTYGALLNEAFRFGRREIGASTTGSGREITLHMVETIGKLTTGEHCEVEKYKTLEKVKVADGTYEIRHHYITDNEGVIYGDTDSCYFKTFASNKEEAVIVADEVADTVNASFAEFTKTFFNATDDRSLLIKASREIVGERGLFLKAKKKYTIRVVDLEGMAVDKLKSMGSEIKKADTPKVIQDFLKGMMNLVLDGKEYDILEKFVNGYRGTLLNDTKDVLTLAPSKAVNNLDEYYAEFQRTEKVGRGKCRLPGHVRAAVNYNELVQVFDPSTVQLLKAGDKVSILYLKPNDQGIKSIGFPADLSHTPKWFDENFQVDIRLTEEKMIDNKIEGIFEALGFDVPTPKTAFLNTVFTF